MFEYLGLWFEKSDKGPGEKPRRRRRIMHSFKIDEISAVDRPAQEGALITIMKRLGAEYHEEKQDNVDKVLPSRRSGESEQAFVGRFLENEQARIDFPDRDQRLAVALGRARGRRRTGEDDGNKSKSQKKEESSMSDEITEKAYNELKAENKELQSQLDTLSKVSVLTDAEKTHYNGLKEEEQTAFLEKSSEERSSILAEIEKAVQAEDPVIFKAADGTEYRKSDDPRLVTLAKTADERHEELMEAKAKAENEALNKRAQTDLSNLPGTVEVHVELLRAVDQIADESKREEALRALKAHNAKLNKAFETYGSVSAQETVQSREDAEKKLDELAKAYQKEHSVDFYEAYSKVCNAQPELKKLAIG